MKMVLKKISEYFLNNKRHWNKLVAVLSAAVAVYTISALILPAITMEGTACQIEEHVHTEECYEPILLEQKSIPCELEEVIAHEHTEECYETVSLENVEKEEKEEKEVTVHEHTAECYKKEKVSEVPNCGKEESEGHTHSKEAGCFEEIVTVICEIEESAGHTHTDTCKQIEEKLVCQLETEGHVHSEECYEWKDTLICEIKETAPEEAGAPKATEEEPQEDAEPEKEERKLICEKEEIIPHTHSEECQDEEGNQICGLEEIIEHIHSEECTQMEEVPVDAEELTCGLEESEAHLHGPLCYGKWKLICGKEEHTHNEECTPILKLTEEERKQVEDVIEMIAALPTYEEIEAEILKFAETEDEEGEEAYYTEIMLQAKAAYEAYNVLTEDQKLFVSNADKLMDLEFLWGMATLDPKNTDDASKIEELLNGDYAYIDELRVSGTVSTGTAPFDNSEGAGNDTTAKDSILRTFDVASYKVEFTTALRQEVIAQDISGYKEGRVYFEIILPVSKEEAIFEKDGMLWLDSAPELKHEFANITFEGKECQVLRGSYMLQTSGSNPAAIGASQNEMTIALRALKMHHGDTITPEVTMWLEHNQVGTEYKEGIPTSIVNGQSHVCPGTETETETEREEHGVEAKTLNLDTITITAAPRYNLKIKTTTSSAITKLGTYDFGSGNEKALNKTAGKMYGRLSANGILLEIDAKDGYGMRGVEFPDSDYEITFTLDISSRYLADGKEISDEINQKYQPLFYSGDGNDRSKVSSFDGREVDTFSGQHPIVPYNQGKNYQSCYNGGNWSFETVDTDTVKVTISGFEINTDGETFTECFPYTYVSGPKADTEYYDSKNINNWWEIEHAVFSAGEIWILQPYNDAEGQYIVDVTGKEGQFNIKIQAKDFCMISDSGKAIDKQTNMNDDKCEDAKFLDKPGSISAAIYYLYDTDGYKHYLTSKDNDSDWAVAGSDVAMRAITSYRGSTGNYYAVAYDQLIKWDDDFFDPTSCRVSNNQFFTNNNYTLYWAAKKDGTGWINDEEMIKATISDLVFYKKSDLKKLKEQGIKIVGVLDERRGIQTGKENNMMVYAGGKIKEDCQANEVYMIVQNSYMWRKQDVADLVAAYYGIPSDELLDSHYQEYMTTVFPTVKDSSKVMLDQNGEFTKDYAKPFWRQDYWYTAGTGTIKNSTLKPVESGCSAVKKAYYDATGYHSGYGADKYQDCCLVIPYKTTITKSVAQKASGNNEGAKVVFDMNQNQRVVDYVLYPKIEREQGVGVSGASEVNTVIHVTDIIPKGLTYIEDSAYLGGDYTQDSTCQTAGTVTGGLNEQKEAVEGETYLQQYGLTENEDGTTTIEWRFPVTIDANKTEWTQPIYFSCMIGTPGQDGTDVKDGDQLTNTVKIWSEGEAVREQNKEFGNVAECGIKIVKSGALSLSKLADQLLTDWWEPMGFTMNVGNNSSMAQENVVIAETMPYNGVKGSSFHGPLLVTEFSAGTMDEEETKQLLDGFQFYYTTEQQYTGKTSSDIKQIMNGKEFSAETGWIALKLSNGLNTEENRPCGIFVTENGTPFPNKIAQEKQITAIVAVGTLPANKTLKMHITFILKEGKAKDKLVNYLSKDSLVSSAKTSVVNRTLEGLAWKDEDGDGERDNKELPLSGVKVSLWKLNEVGTYEKVCYPGTTTAIEIKTGQQVSIQATGASEINSYSGTDTYSSGRYRFTELPAGTYKVVFEDGEETKIQDLIASPVNHISFDNRDSDGEPHYENRDSQKKLVYTEIEGIKLEVAKLLTSGTGESLYHDSGFYDRGYELPSTGGIGTEVYTGGGLAMIAAATILLVYHTKRRDEDECA